MPVGAGTGASNHRISDEAKLKTSLFDFELPDSQIATQPASPRDSARMLVLNDAIEDRHVRDILTYLKAGDVMVFNDTRVIPARLFGKKGEAKVEFLLHKRISQNHWSAFAKPAKKLKIGDNVMFADGFGAEVTEKLPSGEVMLRFEGSEASLIRRR